MITTIPKGFAGWAVKFIRRNYWWFWSKSDSCTDDNISDMEQEAVAVYLKVRKRYPERNDAQLMPVYKTALERRFIDLSRKDSMRRKAGEVEIGEDADGFPSTEVHGIVCEDSTQGTDALLIGLANSLPARDKKLFLRLMNEEGVNALGESLKPLNTRHGGRRRMRQTSYERVDNIVGVKGFGKRLYDLIFEYCETLRV